MTALPIPIELTPGFGTLKDDASLTLAQAFIVREMSDCDQRCLLQHWGSDFFVWDEPSACYRRQITEQFFSRVWHFLKTVKVRDKKGRTQSFSPEPRKARSVIEALAGETQAHVDRMPIWLDNHRPDVADVVSFRNGLLNFHLFANSGGPSAFTSLTPPTPLWFSESALPYKFDPTAKCPDWVAFLGSILPTKAVELLQEWFGYCLTADTRHQKMMVMIGPPRCGKGTIIRALQRVVGEENCASPSFDSLGERFGLEVLVGKRIATVPDAHLGRGSDGVRILDKLLQITGEDRVTVDRKGVKAIASVQLGVRFTLACNEPPDLPDSSGAIIGRLLMLEFRESFVGREDLGLDERLSREAQGIAVWALYGLKRLRHKGRFTEPDGAVRLKNDYLRHTAPVQAFLQDRCELGTTGEHYTPVEEMWTAWRKWTEANGNHPGSKEGFGKRLRAAVPMLTKDRVLRGHLQRYEYTGVRLTTEGELNFTHFDKAYPSDAIEPEVPDVF